MATDSSDLTVAEISANLRGLVARTHDLVIEIQSVVDSLHDYTAGRFDRRQNTTPHSPERRKNG